MTHGSPGRAGAEFEGAPRVSFGSVSRHLEPVPDPDDDDEALLGEDVWLEDEDGSAPGGPPPWWRWVAILVVVAMVVATPFAYALYLLLR